MNEEELLFVLLEKKDRHPQLKNENNLSDEVPSYRRLGLPVYEDQYIYVTPEDAHRLYHRRGKLMVSWRSFLAVLVEVHKDPGYEDIRVSFFPPAIITKEDTQNEDAHSSSQSEDLDGFFDNERVKIESDPTRSHKSQGQWIISKSDGSLLLDLSDSECDLVIDRQKARLILSALPEISRLGIPRQKHSR